LNLLRQSGGFSGHRLFLHFYLNQRYPNQHLLRTFTKSMIVHFLDIDSAGGFLRKIWIANLSAEVKVYKDWVCKPPQYMSTAPYHFVEVKEND